MTGEERESWLSGLGRGRGGLRRTGGSRSEQEVVDCKVGAVEWRLGVGGLKGYD